jgi:hypothetical protein
MRWTTRIVSTGEKRNVYRNVTGVCEGKKFLEYIGLNRMIILK